MLKCKAINLSTEGIGIKTTEPISKGENVVVGFFIPDNFTQIKATGKIVWCRPHPKEHSQHNPIYVAGILFKDLSEDHQRLLQDYILKKVLCNEDLLQLNGIPLVLRHITDLESTERLKCYQMILKKTDHQ